ncbi:MAG: hypothetical protein ACFFCS_16085, partial [Candidatus Hodarchaeota archaeon]
MLEWKSSILFPQRIVCIAGKESKVRLINAGTIKIEIKSAPDCVEALHVFQDKDDFVLTLLGKKYQPETEYIIFSVGDGEEVQIPVRTLTDREFFIVFCLQANFHSGWDSAWLPQYYPELANGKPGYIARKKANKIGPGIFGSSYQYLYDDTPAHQ